MSTAFQEALQPSLKLCVICLEFNSGMAAEATASAPLCTGCPGAKVCQGLGGFLGRGLSVLKWGKFGAIGDVLVTPPNALTF